MLGIELCKCLPPTPPHPGLSFQMSINVVVNFFSFLFQKDDAFHYGAEII